jgi:hypothetical protein
MGSFLVLERSNFEVPIQKSYFRACVVVEIPFKNALFWGRGFEIPVETQLGKEYISGI